MNIKALITMLILGSSSVVMARPVTVPGGVAGPSVPGSQDDAPVVRDHRTQAPAPVEGTFRSPPFIPPWVTIGTADQVMNGAMSFRVSPRLHNGFSSGFTTLRLQSTSGKSFISRVEIKFADGGGAQVVQLGKYLTAGSPVITLDLDGERRAIRSVTVIGRNARQSAFNVQAM